MHMNKAVLLVALLLSGCTTMFTHMTQAPSEFDRELYACQREAAPIQDRARSSDMIERCMAIKGWRKNGYAWGFPRYAPIMAQPSAYTADFKMSVADNPGIRQDRARERLRNSPQRNRRNQDLRWGDGRGPRHAAERTSFWRRDHLGCQFTVGRRPRRLSRQLRRSILTAA